MLGSHFISYSRADGERPAFRLGDDLIIGPPSFGVWIDRRDLQPGDDWDEQLVEALRSCDGLLFIMTKDSVHRGSECKKEWTRALKYKKPVIPLLFERGCDLPYRLEPREYIDFTRGYEEGLARLRRALRWRKSPEGVLRTLEERLEDARRDLRRADAGETPRIADEISQLEQQVRQQRQLVQDPEAAARRATDSIQRGLELVRRPSEAPKAEARTRFINPPPMTAPSYFQDRHAETSLVGKFLKDDALRIMAVAGRGGVGKTAMVCRLLKALENGRLPDDGEALRVDGIVYLSAVAARRITFPNIFGDLCALLPEDKARRLDRLYHDGRVSTANKMLSLLAEFPKGRFVLMLDNFEDVVDGESLAVKDGELDEALRAALDAPPHGVKVLLTTRVVPRELLLARPELHSRLDLDEGLPSPEAEEILRARDPDGKLGLKNAPAALLSEARERTLGYPRALEALAGILSADRDTTFEELLADLRRLQPRAQDVVEKLVGEAYSRLDPAAQQVMQALAAYGIPVPPVAVEYLLQPYQAGINTGSVLSRLVNMQFVRRDAGRYYLHQVDRDYALSRVPHSDPAGRHAEAPQFTLLALRERGAEYFKDTRKPREAWKSLDDLAPQLAEFDLRVACENHDIAGELLAGVSEKLHDWGHYRLAVNLHKQLQGRLADPSLRCWAARDAAGAHHRLGEYHEARSCAELALSIAADRGDRAAEASALTTLCSCFNEAGEFQKALEASEQGISIARDTADRPMELCHLGNRANTLSEIGRTRDAVSMYEQALALAIQLDDEWERCRNLANLAGEYGDLGRNKDRRVYAERAREIAQKNGIKIVEVLAVCHLAECAAFEKRFTEAVDMLERAIRVADEMENPQSQVDARLCLAIILLRLDAHARAGAVADEVAALVRRSLSQSARAAVVRGVVALRRGHRAAAEAAFDEAVSEAEIALRRELPSWRAAYSKALALAGLALCRDVGLVAAASEAYRVARGITSAPGIVADALLDLDLLAAAGEGGLLGPVRAAASGKDLRARSINASRGVSAAPLPTAER